MVHYLIPSVDVQVLLTAQQQVLVPASSVLADHLLRLATLSAKAMISPRGPRASWRFGASLYQSFEKTIVSPPEANFTT